MKILFLPALRSAVFTGAALLFCLTGTACADSSPTLETGSAWRFNGPLKLKGKKDLSAFDSLDGKTGIVASDEGNTIQVVRIDPAKGTLSVIRNIDLMGGGKTETDIEAIAAAPEEKCYYVTGSHALSRKKGELETSRYHIFKVETDARDRVQMASLRAVIETVPELKVFLDKPAAENGADIEGLAWREGRLFVGFRAPVQDGKAWILEVDPACVFGDKTPAAKVHRVTLPAGAGIRAMDTVKAGLVFLSGDSGESQSAEAPGLYLWNMRDAAPERLGNVPAFGAKPEGLYVVSETETETDLLVLCDGVADGAPSVLKVKKPVR